jgi:alpha-tubulin suppressor-like RCC1 family protein
MRVSHLSLLGSLLAVTSCGDQSNTTGNHAHPPSPPAAQGTFISAGAATACTISESAAAYCWGLNQDGEDGTGVHAGGISGSFDSAPVAVPSSAHFQSVSNSRSDFISVVNDARGFTCGVASDGTGYCWGEGGPAMGRGPGRYEYSAGLPDPMTLPPAPASVVGGLTFSSIAAGYWMACGLDISGTAYCWGEEPFIGDGVTPPSDSVIAQAAPVAVAGGHHFQQLVAGQTHACGLVSDGTVYCWGENASGEVGDGTTAFRNAPVQVATSQRFTSLSAGGESTCALTNTGVAYCWGTLTGTTPGLVPGGLSFTGVFVGDGTACGLTSAGVAYCWGSAFWQSGAPHAVTTPVATPSLPGVAFQSLAGGSNFFCGVSTAHKLYCWGTNALGQLGTAARVSFDTLVAVTPY